MYSKLFLRNAKRSIKDYIIYIVTLTLCVSLFYGFMSLSSSKYEVMVKNEYNLKSLYTYIKYSTYIITAAMIFLVNYVNKYMIKRRKREFANYVLLGMEQRNVAFMFFIETLIMGLASIIMGILLGSLFSQALTVLISRTIGSNMVFKFPLYLDTIFITITFFITMFILIGLFNIRTLSKIKLIDMFNDNKKTEIQFSRGKLFYAIVFIISVTMYILIAINMKKYMPFCIVGIIIATYGMFYSASYIFFIVKSKCTRFKYKNTNLFLLGDLLSKMNSNSIAMANVTLCLLASMLLFIMTPIISEWSRGYLDYRMVSDIRIDTSYNYTEDIEDVPKLDYAEVYNYINKSEFGVENYCELELYFINEEDFYKREKNKYPTLAVGLSDYNKLRTIAGYDRIELKYNEFATQWTGYPTDDFIEKYISENSTIKVKDRVFTTDTSKYYNKSIGEGPYNYRTDYLIIFPDEACEELTTAERQFYANTVNDMDYEFSSKLLDFVDQWLIKNYAHFNKKYERFSRYVYPRVKNYEINSITRGSLLMKTQGIYGGVVLMIMCLTILSLQQLSDSFEHKERFKVIKNLGVDKKEINKIILKQIGIYFTIPILISIIGVGIFVYHFVGMHYTEVRLFIGTEVFILNICISITIIVLVYISYFLATYFGFKRNIES